MALNNFEYAAPPTVGAGYNNGLGGLGGVGLVGLIGLNNMWGNNGNGRGNHDSSDNHILRAISDARIEACKTESAIQAAIQAQTIQNSVEFRGLDNKICETQKDAIVVGKDAVINSLQIESRNTDRLNHIERNIDENFCDVKKDIMGVNFNLEKVNTHLTHTIDKNHSIVMVELERKFCELRENSLKDEIERLRRRCDHADQVNLFSNQFSAINSAISDLSQNQRLTNQTIQFGTGNLATPTASSANTRVN